MNISPEMRRWLLTVTRPDPFGEEKKAAEALLKRLEQLDETTLTKDTVVQIAKELER